ncbi:MAG TPA: efflux RND transporter periplasmic adaptor subunit [Burkholderiales bacterium]
MSSEPLLPPPEARRRVPRLSRRMQLAALVALAIAIGAFAAGATTLKHFFGSDDARGAQTQPAPAPGTFRPTKEQWAGLKVMPVESYTFRSEQITDGNIAINEDTTTPVFSPFSGRVTRVIAKLGDAVKPGDPLMAVEASEVVQAQNDLVAALSTLNTARSQLKLAEANEKRQHELYLAKSGALKDWLQSQAELASAQNALRSAETARAAARNRLRILGKSATEIASVENSPNTQQMNPEAIVRAPIGGTVVQRQVGLGQYIASAASGASTTPVYSIGDLSTVWLIANVRETDARMVRIGQPVDVRVLAYPARVFSAHLAWIAPSIDATTRRLPVRAEVENTDGALKPMMFASFSIITGVDVAAPAIPQNAVIYEGDKAHVWLVLDDGTVAARSIQVGRTNDGMVEVKEGLTPGQRIIASGTLFIDRAAQVKD